MRRDCSDFQIALFNFRRIYRFLFFFSSRRRHTRFDCDWSSDVCSSDLSRRRQRRVRRGRQVAPGAHAALVFDGAGYHVAKDLAIPENITLVSLPPYAPELNPIETSGSVCVATNSPSPYSKVTIFRARLVGWRDAIWSANRKQMLHKLVAITAWASLAFIAYATLAYPGKAEDIISGPRTYCRLCGYRTFVLFGLSQTNRACMLYRSRKR